MSELAGDGIPVAVSFRVLKLSHQPYRRWLRDQVTAAESASAYRANALLDAHWDDPELAPRFFAEEARAAVAALYELARRCHWRPLDHPRNCGANRSKTRMHFVL